MSYNWDHTVYSLFRLALSFGHKRYIWAFQVAWVVKYLPADAGDIRDSRLISGSKRSAGEGKGKPLQYSCLKNSWTEELDGLQSIGTQLNRLSMQARGSDRDLIDWLNISHSLLLSKMWKFLENDTKFCLNYRDKFRWVPGLASLSLSNFSPLSFWCLLFKKNFFTSLSCHEFSPLTWSCSQFRLLYKTSVGRSFVFLDMDCFSYAKLSAGSYFLRPFI